MQLAGNIIVRLAVDGTLTIDTGTVVETVNLRQIANELNTTGDGGAGGTHRLFRSIADSF